MAHLRLSDLRVRLLGLILSCALASGGWSHGPAPQPEAARLAGFVALFGSAADLCGGPAGLHHEHADCGLCPAGNQGTPGPAAGALALTRIAALDAPPAPVRTRHAADPRHPGWSGRAPPQA